jgi:hypothetical protein
MEMAWPCSLPVRRVMLVWGECQTEHRHGTRSYRDVDRHFRASSTVVRFVAVRCSIRPVRG